MPPAPVTFNNVVGFTMKVPAAPEIVPPCRLIVPAALLLNAVCAVVPAKVMPLPRVRIPVVMVIWQISPAEPPFSVSPPLAMNVPAPIAIVLLAAMVGAEQVVAFDHR